MTMRYVPPLQAARMTHHTPPAPRPEVGGCEGREGIKLFFVIFFFFFGGGGGGGAA